jgi:outer membrane protein TolC
MKGIRFIIFLIAVPSLMVGQNPGKISLETAISKALKQDFSYLNAVLEQRQAEMRRMLSEKDRWFRLSFDGNYLYRSETMIIDFPSTPIPGGGFIPGREVEAGVNHNFDLKLGLAQPLFTGGILSNSVKIAELQTAVQTHQKSLRINEITGFIKSSYFHYLLLIRRRESMSTLEKNLQLHRRRIVDLLSEGLARRTDLLETLSRIEEIQAGITDVEQAIDYESIRFHQLCGYDPEEIDESYQEKPTTQSEALAHFENNHPVLKSLQKRIDMLFLQKKIASGKYLPQVSGFAELHYGKPGVDYFAKEWTLYFQGGISVTVPLFDWNRLGGEKALIDIQKRKLENQRNEFMKDVTASLKQLFSALQRLQEKRVHINQMIAYSQEDAALKEALYAERQIPNVDYLAALLTKEKNVLAGEEIQIQIEKIKVSINTLIGRNMEAT